LTAEELKERIPESELTFIASRSSGPGGQNVNKVNTKIELRYCIVTSTAFSLEQKDLLLNRLRNKINSSGELVVRSQSERTQLGNREKAVEKLLGILVSALVQKRVRKKSSPTLKSVRERIEGKRRRGLLKEKRRGKDISGEEI
jgi:ribosome-associated protein